MKNKFLISTLMLLVLSIALCTYSFATNNMMESAGNAVENVGNAIGNAAVKTKDAIVGGTQNLANDAANLGNDAMNEENTTENDTAGILDTNNDDYTAQRTATTNTGLFGMSDTMSTWLILGIVGAVIIGLVWYYGAQYEHRNYNND